MASVFTKYFPAGFRLINGSTLNSLFNNPLLSTENTITAKAGGGQASAYQLGAAINRVSVCATNGDSVKLPNSTTSVGAIIWIANDGAATLQVYMPDAGTIDAVDGVATGVTLTNARRAWFVCIAAGVWTSGYMLKSA
jgi:hypothetical protein